MPFPRYDRTLPVSYVWQTDEKQWRTLHFDRYGAVVSAREFPLGHEEKARRHASSEMPTTYPLKDRLDSLNAEWEAANAYEDDWEELAWDVFDFLSHSSRIDSNIDTAVRHEEDRRQAAMDGISNVLLILDIADQFPVQRGKELRGTAMRLYSQERITKNAASVLIGSDEEIDAANARIQRLERLRYGLHQRLGSVAKYENCNRPAADPLRPQ